MLVDDLKLKDFSIVGHTSAAIITAHNWLDEEELVEFERMRLGATSRTPQTTKEMHDARAKAS